MLEKKDVEKFLRACSLIFSEKDSDEDEKAMVMAMYLKSFCDAGMTPHELTEGGMNAISSARYTPKPVDVIDEVKKIRADKIKKKVTDNARLMLAEYTQPDEKGVQMCKEMAAVVSRRMVGAGSSEYLGEEDAEEMLKQIKTKYGR